MKRESSPLDLVPETPEDNQGEVRFTLHLHTVLYGPLARLAFKHMLLWVFTHNKPTFGCLSNKLIPYKGVSPVSRK